MASIPNQYFRLLFGDKFNQQVISSRREVDPTSDYSDVHNTMLFLGKNHLTPEQLCQISSTLKKMSDYSIHFRVKDIRVGDFSPVVFLELAFVDSTQQAIYEKLYKYIFNTLIELGVTQNTTGATAEQHPTCHVTLAWGKDFDHARSLVEEFKTASSLPQIGMEVNSTSFQLYNNDGNVVWENDMK